MHFCRCPALFILLALGPSGGRATASETSAGSDHTVAQASPRSKRAPTRNQRGAKAENGHDAASLDATQPKPSDSESPTSADAAQATADVTAAGPPEQASAKKPYAAEKTSISRKPRQEETAERSAGLGLSVSVGPLLLVPTSKVKPTGGGTLQISCFVPMFSSPSLRRILAVTLEGGWYPLSGKNSNSFDEFDNTDGHTTYIRTEFNVRWSIQTVPIQLGVLLRLPTEKLLELLGASDLPIAPELYGGVGAAGAYGRATATLRRPGEAPFAQDNKQSDFALGYYTTVGGGLLLGPGALTLEYRYSSVRLDFRLPAWNPELGDLGGNIWRLAYRLDF